MNLETIDMLFVGRAASRLLCAVMTEKDTDDRMMMRFGAECVNRWEERWI